MNVNSIFEIINKIFFILTRRQKAIIIIIFLSTLINAAMQTAGVASIVPFMMALSDSNGFYDKCYDLGLLRYIKDISSSQLFCLVCFFVIFMYILKNIYGVFHVWVCIKFFNKVQYELSSTILEGYLKRDYDFFINCGTSNIMRNVMSDPNGLYHILDSASIIFTEIVTTILILIYIVLMDWKMSLCLCVVAVICVIFIAKVFRRSMYVSGEASRHYMAEANKVLLQASEGIKEIQVMRRQAYFLDRYKEQYAESLKPAVISAVGGSAPSYFVEGAFVSGLVLFIGIRTIINPDYISALPILASFVGGAVRMLPSLGRVSSNFNMISFYLPVVNSLYENIKGLRLTDVEKSEQVSEVTTLKFNELLSVKNICWKYPDADKYILDNLSLGIKKGESVGIIGTSGAGKTTLIDIILGVHHPQNGEVSIDGVSILYNLDAYSKLIGFVPQTIYLVDGTVRENVTFGQDPKEINEKKVWKALEQAQLKEFIEGLENGLDTVVGERGIKFSGGQRQRVAIARALYREPAILILDEATSALDNETESEVMSAIEHLYGTVTLIIIAHRLSTVEMCDRVVRIENGRIAM